MGRNLRWLAEDLSAMLQPLGTVVPHSLVTRYLRLGRMFTLVALLCAVLAAGVAAYVSSQELGCAAIQLWAR